MPSRVITNADTIAKGDVIRGIRYGNRTPGNYVIDSVPAEQYEGSVAVYAHREYNGGGNSRFMMIRTPATIIRSYR